jgi:hypothetical protein
MKNRLLSEICKLTSVKAAIELTRQYGGRTLSIPTVHNLRDMHPIVVLIGMKNAEALSRKWGGEYLEIPTEVNALRQFRNESIVRQFVDDQQSIRSLSIEFELDRKAIQNIIDSAGYNDVRLSRGESDVHPDGRSVTDC